MSNKNLSNKNLKNIDKAVNEALNSNLSFKHGCVIEKGGKIIGQGFNSDRSRINNENIPCCHAEFAAISRAEKAGSKAKSTIKGWREKCLLRGHAICC